MPSSPTSRFVQYGCGWSAPENWLNFDASLTLRLERLPLIGRFVCKNARRFPANVFYGDIVRGLPLTDSSVEKLYCSHILEHLSLDECRTALKESFRVLAPGGTFRLVLPDLEVAIEEYRSAADSQAAHRFLESTMLGTPSRKKTLRAFLINWLGGSKHHWMWDYKGLKAELETAGFVRVRRAAFGDSGDPTFTTVEDEERWDRSLGIECGKD